MKGIVPLARNEIAAAVFSKAIVDRKIAKNYLALCSKNVPLGTLKHSFRKKSKSHDSAKPTLLRAYCAALLLQPPPRNLNATVGQQGTTLPSNKKYRKDHNGSEINRNSRSGNQAGSLWQLAELEVLSCSELSLIDLSAEVRSYLSSKLAEPPLSKGKKSSDMNNNDSIADLGDSNCGSGLFECEIRLVIGRTHQIRLQLAAIGASILGDTRYNPVEGLLDTTEEDEGVDSLHDGIQEKVKPAKARGLKTPSVSTVEVTQVAVGDGSHLMGPEPKR